MSGRCGTTFLTMERISLRSIKYLGGGAMVNDYRPNQNYHHQLGSQRTSFAHFQINVGCFALMDGFAGFTLLIFDHNYKMLVNILFTPNGFRRAFFLFSTRGTNTLMLAQRFERYYQPKLQQFQYDSLARSIIESMASPKCSKSTLKNMLQSYRAIDYKRDPIGLITLLCALNECKDMQIRDFSKHLVQFIIRSTNISTFLCDSAQLGAVLDQLTIKRTQSFEKIKETLVKYKTAELIMTNHDSITPSHFYNIIKLLTNNDRLTVTFISRFITVANIFHGKLIDFIKKYLQYREKFEYSWILTQQFFSSLYYFLKDYPTKTDEQAKLLFQFTNLALLSQNKVFKKSIIYCIHRNFPYSTRSPQGLYYKDIILQKIIERSKKNLDEGENWNQGLLCYSILSFEFYKTMEVLQFRYEGELNYLRKQDLRVPQLPEFYWKKYQYDPRAIHKDHIARNIINSVYPQRYKSTPDLQTSTIKPPKITQNQIKIRTISALDLLELKWKREVQVNGRYVDFLIDDIIIECDGDYHFDLYKMDYNESTQFRNLHLLLSGYKLLIFNIFEYNKHRSTQALAELINRKLQALRKHDAVMIL